MISIFDITVLVLMAVFAFSGLRKGLVDEAIRLIGFIVSLFAGAHFYYIGAKLIVKILPITEGFSTVLGFMFIFFALYFTLQMVSKILKSLLRSLNLAWLDRTAGCIFGTLKGIVILSIFVWFICLFTELGFDERLRKSSVTFNMLESFENKAAKMLNLDEKLDSLGVNLRKLFFLDKGREI